MTIYTIIQTPLYPVKSEKEDNTIQTLDDAGDLCRIAEVVLDCADVLELLDFSGVWAAATTV
jgi:hypothetical protein